MDKFTRAQNENDSDKTMLVVADVTKILHASPSALVPSSARRRAARYLVRRRSMCAGRADRRSTVAMAMRACPRGPPLFRQ
jgi:hypothetical protein